MPHRARLTDVDILVGQRLREARIAAGVTGGELGTSIGLSAQQIGKFERGENVMTAGQLWQLSTVLSRPIDWFFTPPGYQHVAKSARRSGAFVEAIQALDINQLQLMAGLLDQFAEAEALSAPMSKR